MGSRSIRSPRSPIKGMCQSRNANFGCAWLLITTQEPKLLFIETFQTTNSYNYPQRGSQQLPCQSYNTACLSRQHVSSTNANHPQARRGPIIESSNPRETNQPQHSLSHFKSAPSISLKSLSSLLLLSPKRLLKLKFCKVTQTHTRTAHLWQKLVNLNH